MWWGGGGGGGGLVEYESMMLSVCEYILCPGCNNMPT